MNNCCCIEQDTAPEAHVEKLRCARKPHVCDECHETIPTGALYEYVWGKWDGSMSVYKTCARCVNIRTDYFTCGWNYTQLVEHFRECFGFDYRDGLPPDFAPCKGSP